MKTTSTMVAWALTIALGMTAGAVRAEEGSMNASGGYASNTANPNQNPATASQSFSGRVGNVDHVNNTVVLQSSAGQIQTVKVDVTTQLTRGGESVTLSQLNLGDVVVAQIPY